MAEGFDSENTQPEDNRSYENRNHPSAFQRALSAAVLGAVIVTSSGCVNNDSKLSDNSPAGIAGTVEGEDREIEVFENFESLGYSDLILDISNDISGNRARSEYSQLFVLHSDTFELANELVRLYSENNPDLEQYSNLFFEKGNYESEKEAVKVVLGIFLVLKSDMGITSLEDSFPAIFIPDITSVNLEKYKTAVVWDKTLFSEICNFGSNACFDSNITAAYTPNSVDAVIHEEVHRKENFQRELSEAYADIYDSAVKYFLFGQEESGQGYQPSAVFINGLTRAMGFDEIQQLNLINTINDLSTFIGNIVFEQYNTNAEFADELNNLMWQQGVSGEIRDAQSAGDLTLYLYLCSIMRNGSRQRPEFEKYILLRGFETELHLHGYETSLTLTDDGSNSVQFLNVLAVNNIHQSSLDEENLRILGEAVHRNARNYLDHNYDLEWFNLTEEDLDEVTFELLERLGPLDLAEVIEGQYTDVEAIDLMNILIPSLKTDADYSPLLDSDSFVKALDDRYYSVYDQMNDAAKDEFKAALLSTFEPLDLYYAVLGQFNNILPYYYPKDYRDIVSNLIGNQGSAINSFYKDLFIEEVKKSYASEGLTDENISNIFDTLVDSDPETGFNSYLYTASLNGFDNENRYFNELVSSQIFSGGEQ